MVLPPFPLSRSQPRTSASQRRRGASQARGSERPRGASRAGWGGAERPPDGEEPGQSPESGGLSAKARPRKRPSAPPREMARRGGGRPLSASRPRWRHYARPRQNTRPAPPLYNASAITQRRRHCARLAPKCKAGARTRGLAALPRPLPRTRDCCPCLDLLGEGAKEPRPVAILAVQPGEGLRFVFSLLLDKYTQGEWLDRGRSSSDFSRKLHAFAMCAIMFLLGKCFFLLAVKRAKVTQIQTDFFLLN